MKISNYITKIKGQLETLPQMLAPQHPHKANELSIQLVGRAIFFNTVHKLLEFQINQTNFTVSKRFDAARYAS